VAEARAAFESTLSHASHLQLLSVQVRCLTGLGQAALAAGDGRAARAAFDAAIELFELQRTVLPGDDMRAAFLGDHLRPYQELLRMALATGASDATLVQLERFRARSLDDRMSEGAATVGDETEQAARERLNWLYRRVQRLHEEAGSSAALSQELLAIERDLLERARRRRLVAPRLAAASAGALDVAELQAALPAGSALVEYGVLDDELFACVVTRDSVILVRHMAAWSTVLETLRGARFQIDALRSGSAPVRLHLARLTERATVRMAQLHALVWAPLAGALAACRRLLLVPHGQLGALPFAALAALADGGVPLGESCELAVVPSARAALRGLRRQPVAARTALALGESSQLPHAAHEAALVAGVFEQGRALVGEQATLQALREHAGPADVVHLACHAQFRSDNPRFSALHLHDGALTVELAEGLALRACTVVLSACETGAAELGSGDEMVGLVRAFLVAGAARVLASQWPVDDEITAGFMSSFYGALAAGQGPAAALRTAQTVTRRAHPHPCHWAAFTLFGGW
jgi:hypothetical protein